VRIAVRGQDDDLHAGMSLRNRFDDVGAFPVGESGSRHADVRFEQIQVFEQVPACRRRRYDLISQL
jgi:hypothetical protein